MPSYFPEDNTPHPQDNEWKVLHKILGELTDGTLVIGEVTNVVSVDLVDAVTEVANVTSVDTVDEVTNVTSVDTVDEVTNVTSVDTVDEVTNVTSVDTVDEVTNVTSVDTVDTVSDFPGADAAQDVTHILDDAPEIAQYRDITLLDAATGAGASTSQVVGDNGTHSVQLIITGGTPTVQVEVSNDDTNWVVDTTATASRMVYINNKVKYIRANYAGGAPGTVTAILNTGHA